jgi:hypothetical protein
MIEVIHRYQSEPFKYGKDCCQFVGDCVEAVTGKNPTKGFEYRNKREALRLIASYGSLLDLFVAHLGKPYDGHKDGDICIRLQPDGEYIAGVVYRNRMLVRTENGVTDWPLEYALAVWET